MEDYNLAVGLTHHMINIEVSTGQPVQKGHKNGMWDILHKMENHHWRRYFKDARDWSEDYKHMSSAKTVRQLIRQCEMIIEDNPDTTSVLTPHPAQARSEGRDPTMYQHTVWRMIFSFKDLYEYVTQQEYRKNIGGAA